MTMESALRQLRLAKEAAKSDNVKRDLQGAIFNLLLHIEEKELRKPMLIIDHEYRVSGTLHENLRSDMWSLHQEVMSDLKTKILDSTRDKDESVYDMHVKDIVDLNFELRDPSNYYVRFMLSNGETSVVRLGHVIVGEVIRILDKPEIKEQTTQIMNQFLSKFEDFIGEEGIRKFIKIRNPSSVIVPPVTSVSVRDGSFYFYDHGLRTSDLFHT